jgi:hypothetical protein
MPGVPRRVAVLDDYQGVAADLADWSGLGGIDVTYVREALPDEAAVVDRLTPFPILVAMRERTAFPPLDSAAAAQPATAGHHGNAERFDRPRSCP